MTIKLYWEQPYEKSFDARISAIRDDGIILDRTLFYPESGNQLSDRGKLRIKDLKLEVDKVSKVGDDILHHIGSIDNGRIGVGDRVEGEIDWIFRYGLMRAHSSQHVLSAVLKKNLDIDTTRATINFEDIFIQISKTIDIHQLKQILLEVNEISTSGSLNINSTIVPYEEARKMTSKIRSKIPKEPNVRLMTIEELDLVCCGGTHVQNSSEIGPLFIYEFRKGSAIRYFVGNRATHLSSNSNIDLIALSNITNTPLEKLKKYLNKQLKLNVSLQNQQKELSVKFLESTSKSPFKLIKGNPIFYIGFNIDIRLINKSLSNFPQNSLIVVNMGDNKIRILSLSEFLDANALTQILIKKYKGKGGGNPKSAQAALEIMPENLIQEIEKIIDK